MQKMRVTLDLARISDRSVGCALRMDASDEPVISQEAMESQFRMLMDVPAQRDGLVVQRGDLFLKVQLHI